MYVCGWSVFSAMVFLSSFSFLTLPVPQVSRQCQGFSCRHGYEAWIWLKITTSEAQEYDMQALKDFGSNQGSAQDYLDLYFPNTDGTVDIDAQGDAQLATDSVTEETLINAEPYPCFIEPDVMVKVKRGSWPSPADIGEHLEFEWGMVWSWWKWYVVVLVVAF
jgi:hypothetical protein